MRFRARTDANQAEIVKALRAAGAKVAITSQLGGGFPDLVVGFGGRIALLEVKDPTKPARDQRLTEREAEFFEQWIDYPVTVVLSADDAFRQLKALGFGS
jgi:hypothetical protein